MRWVTIQYLNHIESAFLITEGQYLAYREAFEDYSPDFAWTGPTTHEPDPPVIQYMKQWSDYEISHFFITDPVDDEDLSPHDYDYLLKFVDESPEYPRLQAHRVDPTS